MLYDLLLRDIIEIITFSTTIFIFCTWLKTDKTKNLLGYFFAYSTLVLCAWSLQLSTLTPFLFTYAPVMLLLFFIVLHEKTLQRNLVALCSITPARTTNQDWIDTTISSCLTTINANKAITVVIEHKNALDNFLNAPVALIADINKNVFDVLLASSAYDEHKMVWINTSGNIRGINASWVMDSETKKDSLFYTLHSDAVVLSADPIGRTFTFTSNGNEVKNLTAHQVRTMLKKQTSVNVLSKQHKGAYRESSSSEKSISG